MKTSFVLAVRNLLRDKRYSLGLFFAYFLTALLCLCFFLFSAGMGRALEGILSRQASSSYVMLALPFSEGEPVDLTEEQQALLPGLPGVTRAEKWRYLVNGADRISLEGRTAAEAEISLRAVENGELPPSYRAEFSALHGEDPFVCGRPAENAGECLVSAAFVRFLGAASAEDLLGKRISLTNFWEQPVTRDLLIAGVLNEGLSGLADMAEAGRYFVFLDPEAVLEPAGSWCYKLYADYADLPALAEAAGELSLEGVTVSRGNNSFAMQKLSQSFEFLSAVLALLAVLCLAACAAFAGGAAVLRFLRGRAFYRAAFSVGLSRGRLLLCFLFEFLLSAAAAFLCALPASVGVLALFSRLASVFVGASFSIALSWQGVLPALLPLALAAVPALLAVRRKLGAD